MDSPESRDRYGINFRVNDPPLGLAEVQFTSSGLPGTVKLGGWFISSFFAEK
jgi:porin